MQKKPLRNKDFRTLSTIRGEPDQGPKTQNPRVIRELLSQRGGKLEDIMVTLAARQNTLQSVRAILPKELAESVTSAGIEGVELRLGASSGAWATRLRYMAGSLRAELSTALGVKVGRVRVRVSRTQGS